MTAMIHHDSQTVPRPPSHKKMPVRVCACAGALGLITCALLWTASLDPRSEGATDTLAVEQKYYPLLTYRSTGAVFGDAPCTLVTSGMCDHGTSGKNIGNGEFRFAGTLGSGRPYYRSTGVNGQGQHAYMFFDRDDTANFWGWFIQVHEDHTFPSWLTTGILESGVRGGNPSYQVSTLGSEDRSAYPRKDATWTSTCLVQETNFFGFHNGDTKWEPVEQQQVSIDFYWGNLTGELARQYSNAC